MAFYGRLDTLTLIGMLPELICRGHLTEQAGASLNRLLTGSDFTMTLYRNRLSHQYAHAGTISLEYEDCPDGMTEAQIHLLLKAIRNEISDVCGCVAADGYRLLDAINPSYCPTLFLRHTRNFTIRVLEAEPLDPGWDNWDSGVLDSCLEAILHQSATLRTLEISVCYGENDRVLGRAWALDVMRLPEQPVRRWFDREWLRDAVTEARREIGACNLNCVIACF